MGHINLGPGPIWSLIGGQNYGQNGSDPVRPHQGQTDIYKDHLVEKVSYMYYTKNAYLYALWTVTHFRLLFHYIPLRVLEKYSNKELIALSVVQFELVSISNV